MDKPADHHYVVRCFHCLAEFDAAEVSWCHHDPQKPTKICPYCLQCFCNAPLDYIEQFWKAAPAWMRQEVERVRPERTPLGKLLLNSGRITLEQLAAAVAEQGQTGDRLGEIFVRQGVLTQAEVDYFLRMQNYTPPRPLRVEHVDRDSMARLTLDLCEDYRFVPLQMDLIAGRRYVRIATVHRMRSDVQTAIREILKAYPVPFLVEEQEIQRVLEELSQQPALQNVRSVSEPETQPATGVFDARRWFSKLLKMAFDRHATEIYIEPLGHELLIRFRVDGVPYKIQNLPPSVGPQLFRLIRRIARLSVKEVDVVQRTTLEMELKGQCYRLHFYILPTATGDIVSIRIVYMSEFMRRLDDLGLLPDQRAQMEDVLRATRGLIVVSSLPMQGMTTTAYAMVRHCAERGRKVATIESMIRYPLDGVRQWTADLEVGSGVAQILEAATAESPEVLYLESIPTVGVLRFVLDWAGQGLCIVGRHASGVADVLQWLRENAGAPGRVAELLVAVVYQRLVRRLCAQCRRPQTIYPALLTHFGFQPEEVEGIQPMTASGCTACYQVGYRGQLPLYEIIRWTPQLGEMFRRGVPMSTICETAYARGCRPIRSAAIEALRQGHTSLEEIFRVHLI